MSGSIPGHALQTHGGIDQQFHPLIPIVHFFQLGADFQGFFQRDMQGGGNQLGNHVSLRIGKVQCAAHIANRTPGSHCTKGSDLCHVVSTVFTRNIFNNFRTTLLAEVRIKVGHTDPLRVQESLENQCILHGIHFCDMQTVGDDRSRTGATSRAHRDPLLLGIADEVPDNEIIVDVSHLADNANLIFQALNILRRGILISLRKTVITKLAEIFLVGHAIRHREGRQMILVECKFQIAHFGNFHGIFKGFLAVGEQLTQFLLTFQIKLLSLEFHAVGIVHSFARLNTQKHILHGCIFFAQVVGIIGDHCG